MMSKHIHETGFTLVELSIVLIVVGLVAGGVVGATGLLRASQLRGTMSQVAELQASMNQFRQKYGCIAGDCYNATRYFGAAAPGGVSNGDGDGMIEDDLLSAPIKEHLEVFRHLGKARMVPGNYRGSENIEGTSPPFRPEGKIEGITYNVIYEAGAKYGKRLGNVLYVANYANASPYWAGILSPEDALAFDAKLDDGIPSMGSIIGLPGKGNPYTECVTTDPSAGVSRGAYQTNTSARTCMLYVMTGM